MENGTKLSEQLQTVGKPTQQSGKSPNQRPAPGDIIEGLVNKAYDIAFSEGQDVMQMLAFTDRQLWNQITDRGNRHGTQPLIDWYMNNVPNPKQDVIMKLNEMVKNHFMFDGMLRPNGSILSQSGVGVGDANALSTILGAFGGDRAPS